MDAGTSYAIKRISFFGREVPVFLQNENGPCPLLAIANVLSLRNEIKLPSRSAREIVQRELISLVADRLLDASKSLESTVPELAAQNVADALEVLSKLTTGIDVNVKVRRLWGSGGGA
jgi:hypothetical protein